MRHTAWLPVLALLVACKPPPEAPEEVGALARFLFAEVDGEEASLLSAADELGEFLATMDLAAGLRERELTVAALTAADVEGLTVPDSFDPATQVAVAVVGRSVHGFDAAIELALEPNQVCIESDTTVYYGRTFNTDAGCFEGGTCAALDTDNEVRKENFLANIWYDLRKEYRRVPLEGGGEALFARSWTEQTAFTDNGNGSIDQSLTAEVWLPDPDDASATLRFYAMWSSVTLSGVGDDLWANLVTSGIDEGFQNADTFVDGGDCANDRDRPYDRP